MQKFTDMHEHLICDGAEVYYNGHFPDEIPTEKRIRNGIAIIDGDKLVFAVNINNQLQGIGLYWELDGEPCYDLIITEEEKTMRLSDLPRYDEDEEEKSPTEKMILELDEKHSNAIAIFGGALWVDSIHKLVTGLPHVIHSAKFWNWHEGLASACRTFCHLCFIDPMLVEAYIGMKFEQLVEE